MVIRRKYKKFDIKDIAINKLEKLVKRKCLSIKVDNIWFDRPVGNIMCVNMKYGYITFAQKDGTYLYINSIKGKDIVNMIDQIKSNNFFSYTETKTSVLRSLKIRPKK